MGNLFSSTPPSRPLEAGDDMPGPDGLGLVLHLANGAPGTRGFVAAVPPPRAAPVALPGTPGAAAAVVPLPAALGVAAAPAAAVIPLRAAPVAVAVPSLGVFFRIQTGSVAAATGIFLALPLPGSPLGLGLFVPGAPSGASASGSGSVPIPAGLVTGLGVSTARRGSGRSPAVLSDSVLPATSEDFLGLELPAEAGGSNASALQLGLAPATLSDSGLPAHAPDAWTQESSMEAAGRPSGASSNRGLGPAPSAGLPTKVSNLIDLQEDCLTPILLSLSRKDLVNLMLSCNFFFSKISSFSFSEDYQKHHKYSPSALVCLFDRESLDTVAVALDEPFPLSLDFVKDKHLWRIIDSRDGFLLLLAYCPGDNFLVCNPLTKTCVNVPPPPGLPPLYSLLAAGLIPEGNASWSIISLFGCTVKSVSRKEERCWVGYFNATKNSWTGEHQEVKFNLPVSRMGVKYPSIVTPGYWNILVFNINILSVDLCTLRLISRKLPFERDVLRINPHVLGRNRSGQLCLVMHDGTDLLVMCYAESTETAEEIKRYSGFAYNMDLSFSEQNCMLLLDGLICFDIECGHVLLPFMVNLDQRIENAVPYEMAWPPKPRLQHGLQEPEGRLVVEEGAAS